MPITRSVSYALSMPPEPSQSLKRKRAKDPSTDDLDNHGMDDDITQAKNPHVTKAAPTSNKEDGPVEVSSVNAAVMATCRSALLETTLQCRAALASHRLSMHPTLAKILELMGSCGDEEDPTPLHGAVKQGDAATAQFLIAAGVDTRKRDKNGAMARNFASDYDCHILLEQHEEALAFFDTRPTALVTAVVAHCSTLSGAKEFAPPTALSLQTYHFYPSFLWAPPAARTAVCQWARNAAIVQLAAYTKPFVELPDDCAGDVLEYLEMEMARAKTLHVSTHCTSPAACVWVHTVTTAAIAEMATLELGSAAKNGDLLTVVDCLAKGAFVDARAEDGFTALSNASVNGYANIVKLLLQAGADTEAKSGDYFYTALMFASGGHGYPAIVKLLLGAGANVDARSGKFNFTALMMACEFGCTANLKLLLEAGADMEAIDSMHKHTALMHAAQDSQVGIVKRLISASADANHENPNGCSALLLAEHAAVAKLLLDAGADTEAKEEKWNGQTALIIASDCGQIKKLKFLLEAGANKGAEDNNGETALDFARKWQDTKAIALLR